MAYQQKQSSGCFGGMAVGCGLIVLGICALCGVAGYLGYQRSENAKKEFADANQLWESGRKAEAISKYKSIIDQNHSDVPSKSERPSIYARLAEYEVEQGNEKAARTFIERAIKENVDLPGGSKKFNELAQVVRTDVEKKDREEKARKESEDKLKREQEKKRQASQAAQEKLDSTDGLELVKETLKGNSNEFGVKITGTVINKSGKQVRYAQITFKLFDASGAQVGTALANINGLEAGGRWNFEATGFGSKFDTFKVHELIGR